MTSKQLTAVFLAALMVTSMVSMAALVAGPATAHASPEATAGPDTNPRDIAVGGLENTLIWQGQEVRVRNLEPGEMYDIRRVTSRDTSAFVREVQADSNGVIEFDTTNFRAAEYFLRGGDYDRDNTLFEVTIQTLSAEWSEETIKRGESADLELSSNRLRYQVEVSAPGLSFRDLERLFDSEHWADDHDAERGDRKIILDVPRDGKLRAHFDDLDAGTYDLRIEVRDSTASTRAVINIAPRRADMTFTETEVTTAAGDIAEFEIQLRNTDTAYFVFGDEDAGIVDVVRVTDRDRDGYVRLKVNTRYVGLNPADPGVPSDVRAYTSPRDRVEVLGPDTMLASGRTLDTLRRDLRVERDGLPRPIRAGDYTVAAATSTDLRVSRGSLDVRDERASAVLDLRRPSLDGIHAMVAPEGAADADRLAALEEKITDRDAVALRDRLVIRTDVSGVFGYLDAEHDGRVSAFKDNRAEGMDLRIEQVDTNDHRDPIRIDIDQRHVHFIADPENNHLYLIVDTRRVDTRRPLAAGQEYEARFRLTGIDQRESRYTVKSTREAAYRGYPYLGAGDRQTVTTRFEIQERRADFDSLVDGRLHVRPEADFRVNGTTNIAPGSQLEIRALAARENPFTRIATVTVEEDGTWEARMDFRVAQIGQTFTASIRKAGTVLRSVQGEVVERVPDPEANLTVTDFDGPDSGTVDEPFEAQATIENLGGAEGAATVEYRFNDEPIDSVDVTLDPGEETTVTFEMTPTMEGTFVHGAWIDEEGLSAEIMIEAPPDVEPPDDEPPDDEPPDDEPPDDEPPDDEPIFELPGFGLILALFALVIAAFAIRRARR